MRRRRRVVGAVSVTAALVLVAASAAVLLTGDPDPSGAPAPASSNGPAGPAGPSSAASPDVPGGPETPGGAGSPPSADPGLTGRPCPSGGGSPTISVASFNVHGGVGRAGFQIDRLAEEIGALDADVVLLQEVHRWRRASGLVDMPAELQRRTGMRAVFGRNFTRAPEGVDDRRRESGTAALSRLPVLSHRNTALPNQPGLQPRGVLRVTVELEGRPVDVYGTHLQHTRGNIRIVQSRGLRRVVARRDRPFVLAGDLNTEPGSRAMRVLLSFTEDPWPVVGAGEGRTVLPRAPRRRIDYVLHGPGWEARSSRTVLSEVADHRAVRTTLALRSECA